jgi:hypothetical protein
MILRLAKFIAKFNIQMAFYRLQYIEFILNFARLKNICKILTTYQGFCNLFSTAQNSAIPAVIRLSHTSGLDIVRLRYDLLYRITYIFLY